MSKSSNLRQRQRTEAAAKVPAVRPVRPAPAALGWLVGVAMTGVAALAIALGWVEIFSPDIGFHLNTGRWILAHHAMPSHNPFLYTANFPYIDLYWLYQISLWLLYSQGGSTAVVASNLLVSILCLALVGIRSWRQQGFVSVALAPVLALWVCGNYWEIRPHTVSWMWLSLILLTLESYRRSPGRHIWFLPVLIAAWVNCHSLYILGLVATGIYAADAMFDRQLRADRRFWQVLGLCAVIPLLNPYGLAGVLYPFQQFGMLQSGSAFKSAVSGISEYQSPFGLWRYSALTGAFNLWQPVFAMHAYTVLAVTVFLASISKASRIEWASMALFGYIFFSAEKNFGYFFVATAPIVVNRLSLLGVCFRSAWPRLAVGRTVAAGTAALLLLATSQVVNGHYYAKLRAPFRSGSGFSAAFLPVGAAEFLRTAELGKPRVLNSLDAGGYLAWQTGRPMFIDGLLESFGPQFYREYNETKQIQTLAAAVAKWRPEIVVVPYTALPVWIYYFKDKARWRLVYYDARDAIFLAPDHAPGIPTVGPPAAGVAYPSYDERMILHILQEHLSRENRSLLSQLFGTHYYPSREIRLSAFHAWCGHPAASLGVALEGLAKATAPSPDLLLNAGHALFALRQLETARYCFQEFLRLDPLAAKSADPARKQANQRLDEIERQLAAQRSR